MKGQTLQLNNLANKILERNKAKGFHDKKIETGTLLMLCVSELSEALEADRKGRYANLNNCPETMFLENFEANVKDTFEDEIADTIIRLLDLCALKGIDIDTHIRLKMAYNYTRPKKHGKKY